MHHLCVYRHGFQIKHTIELLIEIKQTHMKSLILGLFVIASYQIAAQDQDTTQVPVEPAPVTEPSDTPRIIYYQTVPDKQDVKRRDDIRTLSGNMSHSGGFGALSIRSTSFRDEAMVLAGLRGGWIINRTLGIGLEAHGIIPTAKYANIDPDREVVALGGYGGMFLELIFFSNEVVHVTFPVSAGAGWMGYHIDFDEDNLPTAENQLVDEDVFWYVEPGASIEINLSRSFRLALGTSKRFTQDLELFNTRNQAFDKLNYFVTLKVGGF